MLQSKLFSKTEKPAQSPAGNVAGENQAISHQLLERAGYIDQLMAGVYSYLPLGFLVLKNIENIIRKNMLAVDGQEILMPALNPKENWEKTGRWESLDVLFKLKGAGEKDMALAATHEEIVSPLAKKVIFSYKDLPLSVFQFQTKFRNELRAKSGILRTREFLMKDLYSFHAAEEDLDKYYEKLIKTYQKIFKECGIGKYTFRTLASGGSFSKYSDEFQTITEAGEDIIYVCQKCKLAINKEIKGDPPAGEAGNAKCPECGAENWEEKKSVEVGNIFKLKTKYSEPFDLKFKDKDGAEKLVLMGCYGIGLGRVLGAIVEVCHDEKGICWPKEVAPFLVHLIGIGEDKNLPAGRHGVKATIQKIYQELKKNEISVLYDDRKEKSVGEKFAEADLIGIPFRVVVSEKTLKVNSVELKERNKKDAKLIKINKLSNAIK
jgi:prolyl-tRNA synthetase